MDITGEYLIAAPQDRVWAALNDAEVLRQSVPPGYSSTLTLSDLEPPHACVLNGDGQRALVRLTDTGDGRTRLAFDAEIDAGAEEDTRAFFAHLAALLESASGPNAALVADVALAEPAVDAAAISEAVPAESIPLVEMAPLSEAMAPSLVMAAQSEVASEAATEPATLPLEPETHARAIEHQVRPTEAEALGSAGISLPPEPVPPAAAADDTQPAPTVAHPVTHAGLRPMIWIPLLVLVLLLLIVLIR
ncbi:CoxG family protein [Nitrospirillum pindoramense]|uniref:Carbon monoxide dehydrogenase subunit G n=1 Tax=Nitrospirillum amazonense TaxID=28077 RepID=A0A560HDR9_9PROT|nr:hypothetical protein [Nitrospirillum amazonense]TWB43674.1 hypothetical protein FBZ90_10461 [Nitrospirillum amazonense]